MRTNLLAFAFAALLSGVPAFAQVEVKIHLPWAQPPPLVTVEPGVQVVPDYSEEIFFVDGWYWVRRDHRWFRARDHRAGWGYMSAPPRALVRLRPGKYRHWKAIRESRDQRREEIRRGEGPPPARVAPPPTSARRMEAPPPTRFDDGRRIDAPPPARDDDGRRVDAPPPATGRGNGKKK